MCVYRNSFDAQTVRCDKLNGATYCSRSLLIRRARTERNLDLAITEATNDKILKFYAMFKKKRKKQKNAAHYRCQY